MSDAQRKIAGDNNRKGNRYEDGFAVCRLIQLAPRVVDDGVGVSVREQAGCPVDDLLFTEGECHHYYQLKDDAGITWGEQGRKLQNEFVAQDLACRGRGERYTLTVVVSHDHRKKSLDRDMPPELEAVVEVLLFPAVDRPSDLARRPDVAEALRRVTASRAPGPELLRGVAEGFHLAWVESEADADGERDLGRMLAFLWDRPHYRVRRRRAEPDHPNWGRFCEVLAGVPGLDWHADGGHFEWFLPPREAGLLDHPCDSDGFRRFVDRVVAAAPASFDEFEGPLP